MANGIDTMKTGIILFICWGCLFLNAVNAGERQLPEPENDDGKRPLIVPPAVDLRVELTEIVARLAEIPSHSTDNHSLSRNPYYVAAIQAHFAPYKDHPVIEYMRRLGEERGMSYNAIPGIGPCLTDPPALEPRIDFHRQVPDDRWVAEEAYEFVRLLRDFYREADCRTFFESQRERYTRAAEGMAPLYGRLDPEWFSRFFGIGVLNSTFYPVIAPGQGEFNYGGPIITLPDGSEEIYALIASIRYDSVGNPQFDESAQIGLLVHEFGHSFVNPLQASHHAILQVGGEAVFSPVREIMSLQAYPSWGTVLNESLVRAGEVRYFMAHGADPAFLAGKIESEVQRGFVWMPELVRLLDEYENDRETYPSMEHFLPRLARFYEEIAPEVPGRLPPTVERIAPFDNYSENVDPAITEITFHFSAPMRGEGYGFNELPGLQEIVGYQGEDNRDFTVRVKLEPETDYDFWVLGRGFVSRDGKNIQNYRVRFRTGPSIANP